MKKIIIINGSGGVGKDTFVDLCRNKTDKILNISSVDEIKSAAWLLGWNNGKKTEKDRKFLSDLKLLATNYNDSPFEYIRNEIERFKLSVFNIMFVHIREPEEIKRIKSVFNEAVTLLITSNRISEIKSNMADANVMHYEYDYIISNDGTLEEFEQKAYEFLENV